MLLVVLVAIASISAIANSEDAVELMEPQQSESNTSSSVTPRRCDSLETYPLSFKKLIELAPFYMYQANSAAYNCSQLAFVNPTVGRTDYTGSTIVIRLGTTFSIQVTLKDQGRVAHGVFCDSGFSGDFPVVYLNFKGTHSALCLILCTDDGAGYQAVFCAGRTPADEAETQRFINTTLQGVPGIVNTQAGCPKPQFCNFFNN